MTHLIVKREIPPADAELFKRSVSAGKLNKQTIHENGEGKLVGFVAEIYTEMLLSRLFPDKTLQVFADKSYDYDLMLDNLKIDVKCKQRVVALRSDYDVSIAAYSAKVQECDVYAFCSVTVDRATKTTPLTYYFAGFMDKHEYLRQATFKRQGDYDGSNIKTNGDRFTITKDCYNLKYSQLHQFDEEVLRTLAATSEFELIEG